MFQAGLHNLICSVLSYSSMNNSSTPIASVICVSPCLCVCVICVKETLRLRSPCPNLETSNCAAEHLCIATDESREASICVCVIWHWRYTVALSEVLSLLSNATESSRERHIQIMNTNTIALGRSHKHSQTTINNWSHNYILTYDNRHNHVGWRVGVGWS